MADWVGVHSKLPCAYIILAVKECDRARERRWFAINDGIAGLDEQHEIRRHQAN